jgi:uncharacterized heparinase superfamily protein
VIAAALLIQGGPARLGKGEGGLIRALSGAIHDDGGLTSRSPIEQVALVELLAQLRAIYFTVGRDMPEPVAEALSGSTAALLGVLLGDEALSSWQGGNMLNKRRVTAAVEGSGVTTRPLRQARGWGYQRLAAKNSVVVLDGAPPPPARALKGGCASTLAFEFSDGAQRLVINCGGPARSSAHCRPRSSRAFAPPPPTRRSPWAIATPPRSWRMAASVRASPRLSCRATKRPAWSPSMRAMTAIASASVSLTSAA